MDAVEKGAKQGERFRTQRPVFFESLTQDRYRTFGELKARQIYTTQAKQDEFVHGWIAVNQQFFRFLVDGSRRKVRKISFTVECERCGTEEELEFEGNDLAHVVRKYQDKPCPVCQKEARCIDDEFEV